MGSLWGSTLLDIISATRIFGLSAKVVGHVVYCAFPFTFSKAQKSRGLLAFSQQILNISELIGPLSFPGSLSLYATIATFILSALLYSTIVSNERFPGLLKI